MLKKFLHWQGINNPKLMVIGNGAVDVLHRRAGDGSANLLGAGKCVRRMAIVQEDQEFLTA